MGSTPFWHVGLHGDGDLGVRESLYIAHHIVPIRMWTELTGVSMHLCLA